MRSAVRSGDDFLMEMPGAFRHDGLPITTKTAPHALQRDHHRQSQTFDAYAHPAANILIDDER